MPHRDRPTSPSPARFRPTTRHRRRTGFSGLLLPLLLTTVPVSAARAATPCDGARYPDQCGWFAAGELPPYVADAIVAKGGVVGSGQVLVLTSGVPGDTDGELSSDVAHDGCGTNPDGWQTYDCNLLDEFVPPQDSVVLALSSEWFEWYQTIYTDWMTISSGGVATVDVSINSWIDQKVDILPYGPMETGVVLLTSLSADKMVSFRVADSGDHIYDTAILVAPANWFNSVSDSNDDDTLLCGNGTLDPGEECDDGNTITDDDCSSLCLGTQAPPAAPPDAQTCGNLVYAWSTGLTLPYTCGGDQCAGYRCVLGSTISPACYTAAQCAAACAGICVDIQAGQLDCGTLCTVQPPADEPPPPVPPTCAHLVYAWPDGTTLPYTCGDTCAGERCVLGTTISPECYDAGTCDAACAGDCVAIADSDCAELCALADDAVAELEAPCDPLIDTLPHLAANQQGPCLGNLEVCSGAGVWELADGSWQPEDEECNGIDDDCNGVADDLFETCGDPGLCQNTVNTCDPAHPTVPVVCEPLPPPSPVEICNDGLDNDCDGEADDGCECGDDECMPGESFATCAGDCPPPADGTACDDGNYCTLGDAFQSGACLSGATLNTCADDNACTTDESCDPLAGCSATKLDCDDQDPCTLDGCDPSSGCVHDPDPTCPSVDQDGDGSPAGTDCDDANPAVHPGATEACNATDDDCDGETDEGFATGAPCQSGANACGETADGTTVCATDGLGTVCSATTPADPAGYGDACTSAPNACGDTASGTIGCDGTCSATMPPAIDGDGDGTPDCSDACPTDAGKTAPGLCGCGVPDTLRTFYRDADGDGYGNPAAPTEACVAPSGYVEDATDCDDGAAATHPGATETCNGIDDDCNGSADDADSDHDGVGDCADLCHNTRADRAYFPPVPFARLGQNRWQVTAVDGRLVWSTTPRPTAAVAIPTLADTHGCSCKQILDRLRLGSSRGTALLLNQYVLGCTAGTLESWEKRHRR